MPRWIQEIRCPQLEGKRQLKVIKCLWFNNAGFLVGINLSEAR